MRRLHLALAVRDLDSSIADYSKRLGATPLTVVPNAYALWRTDQLNFSINQIPERAGELRHLGFEDDAAAGFSSEVDVNGIEWEHFSPQAQDQAIVEIYGADAKQATP